ncbi:MAG: YVTN family beta-propeller repeat protein [Neomegalonema sp.]|nr:YVTN family beta-propeller repeat protein [Neomegalonema sp.]
MLTRLFASTALAMCTALPALAQEIYVSNEKDDTISVIDVKTLEVTRTFETGERPRGIIFSKDYSRLYVCASDSDTVQVIDPLTGKILHDLPSGEDPEQFALHPNDRHLYIANEDDAITTVVDTAERKVLAQIDVGIEPEGMAVSPDGKVAITTSETTNMVHWIDTEAHALVHNSLVDQRPRHAEFTDDGKYLWVSSEIGGTVTVFEVASKEPVATLTFEIKGIHKDRVQPVGIRLTSDGKTAFIALGPANHVAVVDAQSFAVEEYLLVGRRVWHMDFDPAQKLLFTSNGVSGDVTVIDVARREPIKTIKVGRFPWGVKARP